MLGPAESVIPWVYSTYLPMNHVELIRFAAFFL